LNSKKKDLYLRVIIEDKIKKNLKTTTGNHLNPLAFFGYFSKALPLNSNVSP